MKASYGFPLDQDWVRAAMLPRRLALTVVGDDLDTVVLPNTDAANLSKSIKREKGTILTDTYE